MDLLAPVAVDGPEQASPDEKVPAWHVPAVHGHLVALDLVIEHVLMALRRGPVDPLDAYVHGTGPGR